MLNAAARMIFGPRGRDHVSPLLEQLHWLRIRERISFKVACLTWRCLHGSGPEYLSRDLHRVSEMGRRGGLRSASSLDLDPPRTRNVTHGDRAWPAAAATVWNDLEPESIKSEDNYLSFRDQLKKHLWFGAIQRIMFTDIDTVVLCKPLPFPHQLYMHSVGFIVICCICLISERFCF